MFASDYYKLLSEIRENLSWAALWKQRNTERTIRVRLVPRPKQIPSRYQKRHYFIGRIVQITRGRPTRLSLLPGDRARTLKGLQTSAQIHHIISLHWTWQPAGAIIREVSEKEAGEGRSGGYGHHNWGGPRCGGGGCAGDGCYQKVAVMAIIFRHLSCDHLILL